jgi:hypothetical protein
LKEAKEKMAKGDKKGTFSWCYLSESSEGGEQRKKHVDANDSLFVYAV